jgi:hypothetical protein
LKCRRCPLHRGSRRLILLEDSTVTINNMSVIEQSKTTEDDVDVLLENIMRILNEVESSVGQPIDLASELACNAQLMSAVHMWALIISIFTTDLDKRRDELVRRLKVLEMLETQPDAAQARNDQRLLEKFDELQQFDDGGEPYQA